MHLLEETKNLEDIWKALYFGKVDEDQRFRYLLDALTQTEWRLQSCTARIADLEETARTHAKVTN